LSPFTHVEVSCTEYGSSYSERKFKINNKQNFQNEILSDHRTSNLDIENSNPVLGFAVDMGTSKIICHLVDMKTGVSICKLSCENPQAVHGEDIISRITYVMRCNENKLRLLRKLRNSINHLVNLASQKKGVELGEILEGVLVGNTVMHHFFLGLDASSLVRAPFRPILEEPITLNANQYGIEINSEAKLYLPPPLAGFIGSDAISDLLATGAHESREKCMLIDIGTNTEVFIGDSDGFDACSCASGPAFEGAHIKNGVKALPGAIEHISINPENFQITYSTIDGDRPIGLCGSAMIDVIAEMWKSHLIDHVGRFQRDDGPPKIWRDEGLLLVPSGDAATSHDIIIHRSDVQELVKAKAAIRAACSIMLMKHRVKEEEISRFIIAGDFGSNINSDNAVTIGMIPRVEPDIVEFVGNTAVEGAKIQLVSKDARIVTVNLMEKINYHELSLDPHFNEEYINSLFIPYRG
jgi:uncharacterized 2Fe-2S/4Fe-4S cluster protein (DUF4445 family)